MWAFSFQIRFQIKTIYNNMTYSTKRYIIFLCMWYQLVSSINYYEFRSFYVFIPNFEILNVTPVG